MSGRESKSQRGSVTSGAPRAVDRSKAPGAPGAGLKKSLKKMSYAEGAQAVRPAPGDRASIAEQGFAGAAGAVPHRAEMESAFGADFSDVRAHTGPQAEEASRALGAEAYTVGNRIAFGEKDPSKETVAHELTHTLQQSGGAKGPQSKGAGDTGGLEQEADRAGEVAAGGGNVADEVTISPAAQGIAKKDYGESGGSGTARSWELAGGQSGTPITFDGDEQSAGRQRWNALYNYNWTYDSTISPTEIHIGVGAETVGARGTQQVDGKSVADVGMDRDVLTDRNLTPEDLSSDELFLFCRWYDPMVKRQGGGDQPLTEEEKAFFAIADAKARLMARTVLDGLAAGGGAMRFPDGSRWNAESDEQALADKMARLLFLKATQEIGEPHRYANDWAVNYHWFRNGNGDFLPDDPSGLKDEDTTGADRDPNEGDSGWTEMESDTPGRYTSRLLQQARPGSHPGLIQVVDHRPNAALQHNQGDERIWRVTAESERFGVSRTMENHKSTVFLEYQYVREGNRYFIVFSEPNSGLQGRVEVKDNSGNPDANAADWEFIGDIQVQTLPDYVDGAARGEVAGDIGNRLAMVDAIRAAIHTDQVQDDADIDENMQHKEHRYGDGLSAGMMQGAADFSREQNQDRLVADWNNSRIQMVCDTRRSRVPDDIRVLYYQLDVRFENGYSAKLVFFPDLRAADGDRDTSELSAMYRAPFPVDGGDIDLDALLNQRSGSIDEGQLRELMRRCESSSNLPLSHGSGATYDPRRLLEYLD